MRRSSTYTGEGGRHRRPRSRRFDAEKSRPSATPSSTASSTSWTFPDRVFAFDEFGPLGIRPTGGSCWAKQGKPDRLPATYRRTHGVTYFHGCYSVGDDRLWGINHRRKGTANTLAALKSIRVSTTA